MTAKRLGLFGGTFDPPHNGHVAALRAAWATQRFDHLLVTVAGDPYLKSSERRVSKSAVRLAMAHLAFDDIEGVEVSDLEIIRPGATYTVDTVRELVSASWSVELLVGADAASGLDTWHQANDLATLVTVGIFPREGTTPQLSPMWRYELLAMEPVDLSSTQIRDLEAQGRDISGLLPPGVISLWHQLQG